MRWPAKEQKLSLWPDNYEWMLVFRQPQARHGSFPIVLACSQQAVGSVSAQCPMFSKNESQEVCHAMLQA